ncbi:hypothetical protein [Psychrobacter sp. I-STPA10]|uniref:hypothetical protein n=1 Tax=Psychrobacter sp. I-STPA10 TaxID=2585769 RepID=UPI001E5AA1CA|nr:hypothetical protein [Psychrobacter sp. I-STPA10]
MEQVILTYDIDRFTNTLITAIDNNEVIIRDGVAYWKAGLGKSGIIQHIPFKEISISSDSFIQTLGTLQTTIQNTIVATQAVSTGSLMIATIIQTQILSKKIEAVNRNISEVSQKIDEQNIVLYLNKFSEYLAIIQSLQTILKSDRNHINVIEILANNVLAESIKSKNNMVSFTESLIHFVDSNSIQDQNHLMLVMQFIKNIMELLPIGMNLEFTLSHRLKQEDFSQHLIEDSYQKYSDLLSCYRSYLNKINNKIKYFELNEKDHQYFSIIKKPAKELIQSNIVKELLEKPAKEKLSYTAFSE